MLSALLESNGRNAWTIVAAGVAQAAAVAAASATAPDPNNPLSVYGSSALFNGASFSFTVNKAAAANTASFLFQDGFSGRAQIGLNGNDNFSFKVSAERIDLDDGDLDRRGDRGAGIRQRAHRRFRQRLCRPGNRSADCLHCDFGGPRRDVASRIGFSRRHASGRRRRSPGSVSATNTITLARAGTDTIDGATSAVISTPRGYLEIESNGSNAWTILNQCPMPLTGGAFAGPVTLAPGSGSVAPLKFLPGVSLLSAAPGAVEFDGAVFYTSVAAGERGVVPSEQVQALASPYTLASQTAPQKLLNASASGAIALAVGTYQFECLFALTGMSSTSGSFGFALGGSATFSQSWQSKAAQAATLGAATTPQLTYNTAANAALTTAGVNTTGHACIKGILRVSAPGTVIPEVSLTVPAAAVVAANSYFKVSPLGSSGLTNVGNWS